MRLYLSLTFCLFFHQVHCTDPQAVPVIYHNQMRTDTVSFSFHAMPKGITVTVSPMEDPSEEYVNLAEETGLQIFQGQIEDDASSMAIGTVDSGTFSGYVSNANGQMYIIQRNPLVLSQSMAYRSEAIEEDVAEQYLSSEFSILGAANSESRNGSIFCTTNVFVDHMIMEKIKTSYSLTGPGSRATAQKIFLRDLASLFIIVNRILQRYTFNSTQVSFIVQKIKLFHEEDCLSPLLAGHNPFCTPTEKLEKVLTTVKEYSSNATCTTVAFSAGDKATDITLGNAFVGDPKNDAGICSNVNTMAIYYSKQEIFTLEHLSLVLCHELCHQMGARHDVTLKGECSEGLFDAENLMNPYVAVTSHEQYFEMRSRQSFELSNCSQIAISNFFNQLNEKDANCLKAASQAPVCGNGVVEKPETCECVRTPGQFQMCQDKCCVGQDFNNLRACTKFPEYKCTTYDGSCCNPSTCDIYDNTQMCQAETECAISSYCDGLGPKCPKPKSTNNKFCNNGSKVCFGASCSTICSLAGLEESPNLTSDCLRKCVKDGAVIAAKDVPQLKVYITEDEYTATFVLPDYSACAQGKCNNGECLKSDVASIAENGDRKGDDARNECTKMSQCGFGKHCVKGTCVNLCELAGLEFCMSRICAIECKPVGQGEGSCVPLKSVYGFNHINPRTFHSIFYSARGTSCGSGPEECDGFGACEMPEWFTQLKQWFWTKIILIVG